MARDLKQFRRGDATRWVAQAPRLLQKRREEDPGGLFPMNTQNWYSVKCLRGGLGKSMTIKERDAIKKVRALVYKILRASTAHITAAHNAANEGNRTEVWLELHSARQVLRPLFELYEQAGEELPSALRADVDLMHADMEAIEARVS